MLRSLKPQPLALNLTDNDIFRFDTWKKYWANLEKYNKQNIQLFLILLF